MPITQLQDQGGIGTAIGMVGGYLLGNPARKAAQADRQQKLAQQAIENKRNALNDQRLSDEQKTNAQNVADEIKTRDATSNIATTNSTTKALSNTARTRYFPMLSNTPQGPDGKPLHGPALANALVSIRNKAIGDGMTDSQDLTQFNTEIARIAQADQQQTSQQFIQREQALPSDPNKAIGTLMKRQQLEGGVPGIDPKRTQGMITATQKQITDAHAAAHQAVMEGQGERRIGVEQQRANRPQRPDHFGEVTPAQQHQWDLEAQRFGLETRRFNAEFPGGKKPLKASPGDWPTIKESSSIKALPPSTKALLQQGVAAYGVTGAIQHLNDAIKTKKFPPGFDANSAQAALDALNSGQ